MIGTTDDGKKSGVSRKAGLRRGFLPLLTLLLVVAISIGLFFWGREPETIARLKSYGYLGAFLVGLIGNATILLPSLALPVLCALAVVLYPDGGLASPIMVGLVGGAGAAIGEIVGYMAGYGGRRIVENNRLYERLADWVRRWGTLAIFIFALVPLFFDLVGLAAGALRFPLWKFVLACWSGRSILYIALGVAAALGWETVLGYFG